MNLESNCTSSYNSSCDPTSLSCYFISSLSKLEAVKLNHFTSEEGMKAAFSRADLRASIKVAEFWSLATDITQYEWSFTVSVQPFLRFLELL